jgi:hypothetical protein
VPEDYFRVLKENKQIEENIKIKKGNLIGIHSTKSKINPADFDSKNSKYSPDK